MSLSCAYSAVVRRMAVREPAGYLAVRLLLPRPIQDHALAIAWFVCATDDIVDTGPVGGRAARFADWDRRIRAALAGASPARPRALAAFLNTARVRDLPGPLILACLDGLRADLTFASIASERDYQSYVDRVTMPALRLIMAVHPLARGPEFTAALRHLAESCQRIDILDDLADDLRARRLFLPADELRGVGVRPEDLFAGRTPRSLRPLLADWADRARQGLRAARRLIPLAPAELRPLVQVLVGGHEARLAGLERAGLRILRRKVLPPVIPAIRIILQGRKSRGDW
ncbi:squalene/phytoene synthase family protein [Longispora urticae]